MDMSEVSERLGKSLRPDAAGGWPWALGSKTSNMLAVAPEGAVLGMSAAAARSLLCATEPCGLVLGDLVVDHEMPRSLLDAGAAGVTMRRKDGSCFDASCEVRPLREGEGDIVLVSFREVPEGDGGWRSLATKAIACAPDAVIVRDATGLVLIANACAEKFYGVGPGELNGRRPADLMDEAAALRVIESDRVAGEMGEAIDSVIMVGDLIYQTWKRPLRDDRGQVFGVVCVARDVTEERRTLEAARQAAAAGTRLLAGASHDLRQPVQTLYMLSNALSREKMSSFGRTVLNRLDAGLDTMRDLLDGVLDASRIEAGALRPLIVPIADAAFLGGIATSFEVAAEERDIEMAVSASGARMASDKGMLNSIVRNLVQNALRYTERGGRVELSCKVEDGFALIEVRDNGKGIPPDRMAFIWGEFSQVASPIARKGGVGLGLSIVSRLCRALAHRVEAESRPGVGSCFRVWVPLSEGPTSRKALAVDKP